MDDGFQNYTGDLHMATFLELCSKISVPMSLNWEGWLPLLLWFSVYFSPHLRCCPRDDWGVPLPSQAENRHEPSWQQWGLPGQSSSALGAGGRNRTCLEAGNNARAPPFYTKITYTEQINDDNAPHRCLILCHDWVFHHHHNFSTLKVKLCLDLLYSLILIVWLHALCLYLCVFV